jgi:hypothetical protein
MRCSICEAKGFGMCACDPDLVDKNKHAKQGAKLFKLDCLTRHDLDTERVLLGAIHADLEGVVVMGYDKEGGYYFASSYADGGTCLWLVEKLKMKLLGMEEG